MIVASLIIPTYNEAKNLPLFVSEIEQIIDRTEIDLEYIVVDDNSPDGTGTVAEELAKKYPVRVIHRAGKQGLGSAVRAGFAASTRPVMAVMDADLSHDPAILPQLLRDLNNHDVAVGSRFAPGSSVENWQAGRKLLSQVGVLLARRLTKVQDPLSGFFAFRRTVIDQVTLTTVGYKILLEILVKGHISSVTERAFHFRMRRHSTSKLNIQEYRFFAAQLFSYGMRAVIVNIRKQWPVWLVFIGLLVAVMVTTASQSIWLDEGLSQEFSQRSVAGILEVARSTDLHPPLYYLFLHSVGQVTGFGVVALRLWSALWYGLFLLLLYRRIVKPSNQNPWNRAAQMAIIGLVPFGIFYANELRSYAAIILVSAWQFFAFIDLNAATDSEKKRKQWWYGLTSFILLNLFYPGAFTLVAQFLYISIRRRQHWLRFFWPWLATTIAFSPWLFTVVLQRAGVQPGHFLAIPWWQIPAVIAAGFAGGRVAVTDMNHLHQYWPTAVALFGMVVGLFGLVEWWRRERQNPLVEQLVWLMGVPILICLVISATRFSIFDPRYYTQIYPLYVILLITSIQFVWKSKRALGRIVIGVVIVSELVVNGLYWFNPWYAREPWKTVVPQVEAQLAPDDAVMFIGKFQPPPTYAAYQTKPTTVIGVYPDDLTDVSDSQTITKHIQNSLVGVNRVWYSQFLEWQKDPTGEWRKVLEAEGFKYQQTVGFFKVKFDLYGRH